MDELYRIEQTLVAFSTTDLSSGSPAESCIRAFALSSKYNKIGGAVLHLINKPNRENMRVVKFALSGELVKLGVCSSKDSIDVANDALLWWLDPRCTACEGRGVLNQEQQVCPYCGGNGKKPAPSSKIVQDAVGVIDGAINWLENQQRARLKSW